MLLRPFDQIPFVQLLLPPPHGLRSHDSALNLCPNTVGAGFLLVVADLALLAEDT